MFVSKSFLPRRLFLKGMGATLALPLLDAMVPALTASAQTAAQPVRRFGHVFVPLGFRIDHWKPAQPGVNFEFTDLLMPLEPYRRHVSVISNLYRQPNGAHGGSSAWLTGVQIKQTEAEDVRAGQSLDQTIADHIGSHTQFKSLEVAIEDVSGYIGACDVGYSCTYVNTTSWKSDTIPLPMETNPRALFEQLFGGSGTPEERALRRRQNASILDSIRDDAQRLGRGLGPRDRVRLDEYLDNVREIEQRIQRAETQNAVRIDVPDQPVGIPASYDEHVTLMYDMLKIALESDMTRVFSFMVGREVSQKIFPDLGVIEPWHHVSHHKGAPDALGALLVIQHYMMQKFTDFIDQLAQTPDGDGTLLDHTAILLGSGMSESDIHQPTDLPVVLVGLANGAFKGNQHLLLPETPTGNAFLSIAQRFGLEIDAFGVSTGTIDL
jgi:hypothetical protein